MSYYFSKTIQASFDDAVQRVIAALSSEGFGVLSDIDVSATLKKKLDIDFPKYRILGACNPTLAHQALTAENKIGTMLPCNVVVRDAGGGATEIAAIDPVASMQAINNPALHGIAAQVRTKLAQVVEKL